MEKGVIMTEPNLSDDAPWLNLSKEEVEELRYNKRKLTEYGKEKIKKLLKEND